MLYRNLERHHASIDDQFYFVKTIGEIIFQFRYFSSFFKYKLATPILPMIQLYPIIMALGRTLISKILTIAA